MTDEQAFNDWWGKVGKRLVALSPRQIAANAFYAGGDRKQGGHGDNSAIEVMRHPPPQRLDKLYLAYRRVQP